ncbi:MAG: flagellar hook-length control protein FliK [Clostridiales bacterium]|nr:flagellar hook-length control protein FliK [Clostridiales bacterium]
MEFVSLTPQVMDILPMTGTRVAGTGMSRGTISGDAFAQLFLQLTGGTGGDGMEGLLESLLWQPEEEKAQGGKPGVMEMLMAMLDLHPAQFDFRQLALTETEEGAALDFEAIREVVKLTPDRLSEWLASLGGQAIPEALAPVEEEALPEAAIPILIQDAMPQPPKADTREDGFESRRDPALPEEPYREMGGIPLKVLGYENPGRSGPDNESVMQGQESFRQAVREVRSKLSDKGNKAEGSPAEILLGQSAVRANAAGSYMAAEAKPTEAPGLPDQIFLGLSQNLKAGRGEFVIKLVPENLGEITVKLLAKEGRTTLRIITASAETARLINNDLAALQNALKPIRVEVQQAVPETPADREAGAYFAGYDQFGQFDEFNQYGNQGDANPYYEGQGAAVAGPEADGGVIAATLTTAPDSELDMYV